MDDIRNLQNEPQNLKYLAAQRVLYSKGKRAYNYQILLTVILSVIFSFLKLIPQTHLGFDLGAYIGLLAIIISFADILFFNVYISKLRTSGAKIQELFDCNLFGLPWNATNSGSKPEKYIVDSNAQQFLPSLKYPLENWYDINLDNLSSNSAVLLCQETNLFYDGKLREHFKWANILLCILVLTVSLTIAIILDIRVSSYLTEVLLPVLPIVILTLKIIMENRKSLIASAELKKTVLDLKARTQEPTLNDLRQVQDKIYCSRKDSAFVPEWYYKWRRSSLEQAMQINASA